MPGDLELATLFFLQVAVILAAAHGLGAVFRRIGQPEVVAHMFAGMLLGASGLGWVLPGAAEALFPATVVLDGGAEAAHPSRSILYTVAQLAVALYMFCVGMNFDAGVLRRHARESAAVAATGFAVPVLAGAVLGLALVGDGRLFASDAAPWQVALFVAAATSVAALPVLARIIEESGLSGGRAGTIALGGAVVDDVVAWLLLAVTVAGYRGDPLSAAVTAAGTLLYVAAVVLLGRPLLRRIARSPAGGGERAGSTVAVLALLMLGAWFTEWIAIYAVFGAFLLGLAMPRGAFADRLRARIEPVTVSLLLPVFFCSAGLDIRLALLGGPGLVAITAAVAAVAFASKAGACTAASRLAGASWPDAAGLGVLMNARGLTGLVLIGIGLKEGLLTGTGYTVLAVTILLTTVAVAPGRALVHRLARRRPGPRTEGAPERVPAAEDGRPSG
ncbi:cation:proton antiporter [Nocardiopsis composta]|uniref:Kef-type K+ transport system membrane component KefB n=1 Tax=Nocardiopsis composta TaxID=157465 RepID=A0A7W8QK60_9ACTN|nr:cation:proton antiporter [Nocardiopsis composta]MBB5431298.1 Kef-type K+ transport system membrane component KefB [Nocardiopsis composta]